MGTIAQKPLIYGIAQEQLKFILKENGFKPFNAEQVFSWIYKKYCFDVESWTNISKELKAFLIDRFDFTIPKIIWNGLSTDGTRKFLVGMRDSKSVETVMIAAESGRRTLCISSQVGCAIGCTFCHTGTMGLTRNLESGEIVGQFIAVQNWLNQNSTSEDKLSNIVFMGQGEPLHNFEHVKNATKIFVDEKAIGLGQRRVTISTSGLVPQIKRLDEFPSVNIAISLHAAHNDIRTELMPINKAYDLDRLLDAIKQIPLKAHRYITYEYLLIDHYNDREEDVRALVGLLPKKVSKVNLIPFNEYPESKFKRPSIQRITWFRDQLENSGITCTIRATKGADILAACGQLKSEMDKKLNLWQAPVMGSSESTLQL